MNQSAMLARFARETELDVFLVAGRYTLLDQDALAALLPFVHGARDRSRGRRRDEQWRPGRSAARHAFRLRSRRLRMSSIAPEGLATACERHGVPLKAAAVQFPLAHPAVVGLLAGVRTVEHLDEYPALMRLEIPAPLWEDLRDGRPSRSGRPGAAMNAAVGSHEVRMLCGPPPREKMGT